MKKSMRGMFLVLLCSAGLAHGADRVEPFNGKDLAGWKVKGGEGKNLWLVGAAELDERDSRRYVVLPGGHELINNTPAHGKSLDLYSEAVFGDAIIRLEVMVPRESNSGVYVMGEYEVQVLDSHGKDANPGAGDMGAVYGAQPPSHPKYRAPGEWNTYEIHWRAPRFDGAGKKVENARFLKVILNGVTIHADLEMPGPTPGGVDGREKAEGPLMFQGNHGAVSYRNIRVEKVKWP
ncbi:MAG: hypothetical protein RI897_2360 [Verrucomicrobiota bacterium]|jgi:hypothetical protein